jgi:hypothetical protein
MYIHVTETVYGIGSGLWSHLAVHLGTSSGEPLHVKTREFVGNNVGRERAF